MVRSGKIILAQCSVSVQALKVPPLGTAGPGAALLQADPHARDWCALVQAR